MAKRARDEESESSSSSSLLEEEEVSTASEEKLENELRLAMRRARSAFNDLQDLVEEIIAVKATPPFRARPQKKKKQRVTVTVEKPIKK